MKKSLVYLILFSMAIILNILVFLALSPKSSDRLQKQSKSEAVKQQGHNFRHRKKVELEESGIEQNLKKETTEAKVTKEIAETKGGDADENKTAIDESRLSIKVEEEQENIRLHTDFERLDDRRIKIKWLIETLENVAGFSVVKRETGPTSSKQWQLSAYVSAMPTQNEYFVVELPEQEPKQYEYRVDVEYLQAGNWYKKTGKPFLASNLMICIDPGHFRGKNKIVEDKYPYAEGDFTLELGLALKEILYQEYGITSYLTRETGDISLGGYSNEILDSQHLSLRGNYADLHKSDLFLSLHTNANNNKANGYDTWQQPIALNKPILIANTIAASRQDILAVGNAIGRKIAAASFALGISTEQDFEVRQIADLQQWTDKYNDALQKKGMVLTRSKEGRDVYGVLRGATEVGVPGFIIEHGHHTIPEVRKAASKGNLKYMWAKADADGIAQAYQFIRMRKE